MKRTKKQRDGVSPEVRVLVMARARDHCEVQSEGCTDRALGVHHRLKREHGCNTAENLVVTCPECHTASPAAIHRNVAWAYEVGLLVHSWDGPPTEAWVRPR